MRVLWFINTPALAGISKDANIFQGGWISSLERQISTLESVQLAIAYPGNRQDSFSFSHGKTIYYNIPESQDKGIIKGILGRWRHLIESEDNISHFLTIIEEFKPDVIHVFGSERQYGLISTRTKIPVIIQIQGNLTVCYQKWFSGLTYLDVLRYCNKKNLILGYGIFHQYYLLKKRSAREQKILSQCEAIIGRTEWDRRIMRVFAPKSRYFHCEELIRDPFFVKSWQFPTGRKVTIISTLSPIIYKGLEIVLKTAYLLRETGNIDFEWSIAGVGGREDLIDIIERANRMKFSMNNVKFLGSLDASELASALVKAHFYVHPSHIENSPNSICEAMITGTPVIATFAGGTASILKDSVEGILVQDGDPYALAGAILSQHESPESMMGFSKNARQTALSRHNPERVVKEVVNIYREVIDH